MFGVPLWFLSHGRGREATGPYLDCLQTLRRGKKGKLGTKTGGVNEKRKSVGGGAKRGVGGGSKQSHTWHPPPHTHPLPVETCGLQSWSIAVFSVDFDRDWEETPAARIKWQLQ